MQLNLTPEQADAIRRAIDDGRVDSAENALHEAVDLWSRKEKIEEVFREIYEILDPLKGEIDLSEVRSLLAFAVGMFELETTDDPFLSFEEWNSDADRKAYADL